MVPNGCSRGKTDLVARLLQAPTQINIVAGGSENWIKASNLLQRRSAKRHVAARYMLGKPIVNILPLEEGETITKRELLNLPARNIIHRLYHQEDIRLFMDNHNALLNGNATLGVNRVNATAARDSLDNVSAMISGIQAPAAAVR